MDVVLSVGRQVVVDDERDLLDVDTSGEEIGGDEHARGSRAELAHDDVSLLLIHVAVHGGHGKVAGVHLLSQPIHFPVNMTRDL